MLSSSLGNAVRMICAGARSLSLSSGIPEVAQLSVTFVLGYVRFDRTGNRDELEFKLEIQRMLWEGVVIPKGRFGYLSPHPTLYRTLSKIAYCK